MHIPRFISTVSVTGADSCTSIKGMLRLQKRFPFAEFGILFSMKHQGYERYPSYEWVESLTTIASGELRLSAHLCGQIVRDILENNFLFAPNSYQYQFLHKCFSRIQLNTHGEPHSFMPIGITKLLSFCKSYGSHVIFQYDNTNNDLISYVNSLSNPNVDVLFDLSHGCGILPEAWPTLKTASHVRLGYAGGLSGENLESQIPDIFRASNGEIVWIDAETQLRTNDLFDLGKVESFLLAAEPYVVEEQSSQEEE